MNLQYIESHKFIINCVTFLALNYLEKYNKKVINLILKLINDMFSKI